MKLHVALVPVNGVPVVVVLLVTLVPVNVVPVVAAWSQVHNLAMMFCSKQQFLWTVNLDTDLRFNIRQSLMRRRVRRNEPVVQDVDFKI